MADQDDKNKAFWAGVILGILYNSKEEESVTKEKKESTFRMSISPIIPILMYIGLFYVIYITGLYKNVIVLYVVNVFIALIPFILYLKTSRGLLFIRLIRALLVGFSAFLLSTFLLLPCIGSFWSMVFSFVGVAICMLVFILTWCCISIIGDNSENKVVSMIYALISNVLYLVSYYIIVIRIVFPFIFRLLVKDYLIENLYGDSAVVFLKQLGWLY